MASVEIEKFTGSDGTDYLFRDSSAVHTVDSAMSSTSTNPVQNKVVNTAIANNSTADRLYANQTWGGAFRTSLSPMDTYLFMQRNCFFGLPADAVSVEYSNDGGATWEDYGLTNEQKVQFFSQYNSVNLYCGKAKHVHAGCTDSIFANTPHDLDNSNVTLQRLRITLNCCTKSGARWLYCNLRRVGLYISTQSASAGTHCVFEGRIGSNYSAGNDTWTNFGDFNIAGDSGWNSIPCRNATSSGTELRFGNGSSYYREVRWTIWSDKLITTPHYSQTGCIAAYRICGFSELLWANTTTNTNMAAQGAPYTVNPYTGTTSFAKGISSVGSTIFQTSNGGTGNASGAASLLQSAGRIANLNIAHAYQDSKAHLRLDTSTTSVTTGKPRDDGYVLTLMWDVAGIYDTQIFIPNPDKANQTWQVRGHTSSGWTDWSDFTSAKANKLTTARNLGVDLARTDASSFDGSANQLDIPVKGVLPVANGGTGAATSGDARNALSVYSKSEVDDKIQQASEIGNAKKLYDINGTTNYITGQYSAGDEHNPATFTLSNANGAYVMVDGATFAEHADSADNALQAQEAQTALNADNAVRANSASTADTATTANGLKIRADETITPYILAPVVVDDYIGFGTTMSGKKVRVDSATTSDNTYALQSLTDFNHRWSSPNFDHVNANRAFCRVDVATSAMGDARPVKNDGSKGDGYLLTLNWDGTTTADCQLCIFNGTTNGGQPVIRWHKNDGTWTAWQGLRARGFADQNGTQADFYFSNDSGQKVSPDYSFSTGSQDTPHMLCVIKDDKDNRQIVNVLASKITVQKAKEAAVTTVSSGTVSLAASAYANTGGHWSIVSGATISGGPNTSMALPVLLETILMGSWYSVQRVTDANGDCWTRVVKSNSSRTSWKKLTP